MFFPFLAFLVLLVILHFLTADHSHCRYFLLPAGVELLIGGRGFRSPAGEALAGDATGVD